MQKKQPSKHGSFRNLVINNLVSMGVDDHEAVAAANEYENLIRIGITIGRSAADVATEIKGHVDTRQEPPAK